MSQLQWGSLWHRVSGFLTPSQAHRLALTCRFFLLCAADMLPGHQRASRSDPSLPHLSPVYGPLFRRARHVFQCSHVGHSMFLLICLEN